MVEAAIAYVGAFLARKALGVVKRAGGDIDSLIDQKLSAFYDWVKGKLTGKPAGEASLKLLEQTPEGKDQQELARDQLTQAIGNDPDLIKELQALLVELDRIRPAGVSIRGLAYADDLGGSQAGVVIEGRVPDTGEIVGEGRAKVVRPGGTNVGVHITPPSS